MFTPHQGHPNCEGCGDITPVEGLDLSYGRLLCCVCFEAAAFAAKEDCSMVEDCLPTVPANHRFDTEPVDGHSVAALSFPGGDVELPKPTRFDLALSGHQWLAALKDHMVDWNSFDERARGLVERIDAIFTELGGVK